MRRSRARPAWRARPRLTRRTRGSVSAPPGGPLVPGDPGGSGPQRVRWRQKPTSEYPASIKLDGGLCGRNVRKRLTAPDDTVDIGVLVWPRPEDKVSYHAGMGTPGAPWFMRLLERHGFNAKPFDPDHVVDTSFGGDPGSLSSTGNLWPLGKQVNRDAGRRMTNQRVEFSPVEGGAMSAALIHQLDGKWFRIARMRLP